MEEWKLVNQAVLLDFLAFSPAFHGGANIAVGDINADGYDDIIAAPATGGPPVVRIYSGSNSSLLGSFEAYRSEEVR